MKYYLVIISLLLLLLVACINQPPLENELNADARIATSIAQTISPPTLVVSQENKGPNQQIFVEGTGFPENQIVVIYYADSETNLGPAVAQVLTSAEGSFVVELLTPTAWPGADFRGQTRLQIVAEAIDSAIMSSAPIVIDYQDALARYENLSAGYAVEIPADWAIAEVQITPLGELVMLGPEPVSPGNPSNSMIIFADSAVLDEAAAAQYLICGTPNCTNEITFDLTTVNGFEAKSLIVGSENTPNLEWFFVRHEDRLIYFTLHDPLSLETVDALVQSFSFIDTVTSEIATLPTAESSGEIIETVTPFELSTPTTIAPTQTPEPSPTATETFTPTLVSIATLTSTPTALLASTPSPTVAPTKTSTPTSTPSSTPTSTSTASPTLTSTTIPTRTPLPTATATSASANVSVGPLETLLELLTIVSLGEEDQATLDYFTLQAQAQIKNPAGIQPFLKLGRKPFSFSVARLQGVPIVRASIETFFNGPIVERDFEFEIEDGQWRVDAVNALEVEDEVGDEDIGSEDGDEELGGEVGE